MENVGRIDEAAWEQLVKNILRAEMMLRGISYEQLVARLAALGIIENVPNLRNKVARGRFGASFFAQCMVAIGVDRLQIPTAEQIRTGIGGEHGAQVRAKGKRP
ncbi:DUF6471 domain-containing protein [Croceibacterium mercuriale]|uniref:DUF6471 domain-containing protein n=1 Tax=Croceibacterium mercuriale TaxID=1572751 RepID=UPI000AE4F24D|nr:DUF6471 domain-containing protein [Croceibacterium mercuriale]